VNSHAQAQLNGQPFAPELRIDSVLSLHALTLDLIEKLNMLAPYGSGHAEPRFALTGVKIIKPRVVGENHVSCFIQDTSGGASLKGIAFRAMDSDLGELLLKSGSAPVHLAGHVSVNEWNGKKTVDFQIVDAAPVWNKTG
jgi:single-stranded-DNA-specific exonuclease